MQAQETTAKTPLGIQIFWILLFALLAYQMFFSRGKTLSRGAPAPSLSLQSVATSDAPTTIPAKKQITVLHFWAMWCPSCVRTLRSSTRRALAFRKRGVQYLMVNVDEPNQAEQLKAFLRRQRISTSQFTVHFHDARQQALSSYGVRALPSLVIVDQHGKIGAFIKGYIPTKPLINLIQKVKSMQNKPS